MTFPAHINGTLTAIDIPAREFMRIVATDEELKKCLRKVTAKELAENLSVSEVTVYRWASEQVIPSMQIGGVLRFDLFEVEKAIKERHTLKAK